MSAMPGEVGTDAQSLPQASAPSLARFESTVPIRTINGKAPEDAQGRLSCPTNNVGQTNCVWGGSPRRPVYLLARTMDYPASQKGAPGAFCGGLCTRCLGRSADWKHVQLPDWLPEGLRVGEYSCSSRLIRSRNAGLSVFASAVCSRRHLSGWRLGQDFVPLCHHFRQLRAPVCGTLFEIRVVRGGPAADIASIDLQDVLLFHLGWQTPAFLPVSIQEEQASGTRQQPDAASGSGLAQGAAGQSSWLGCCPC